MSIDVTNKWMVGALGKDLVLMDPPRRLTPDEALVLAAWLVSLAEYQASEKFQDVLTRVQNT